MKVQAFPSKDGIPKQFYILIPTEWIKFVGSVQKSERLDWRVLESGELVIKKQAQGSLILTKNGN